MFLYIKLSFVIEKLREKDDYFMTFKLKRSMGGVDWVGGNEWSSFFEEIVELTVFSSGAVVLSDLIGSS